jgi:hypothetical protein
MFRWYQLMFIPVNLVMKTLGDVESECYCDDLLKPLEVNPLHVVFSMRGFFTKQGKSFKPCTLTPSERYRNLSTNPYVIRRSNLHEFMYTCLQQFVVYIWTKCKPYKISSIKSWVRMLETPSL